MINIYITANDISSYIDFLCRSQGFFISLHGDIANSASLVQYNFHINPCCLFVKYSCYDTCVKRQYKVYEKCKDGDFFGTCYAGIGEYVYPLCCSDKIFGFICVSGYRGDDELTRSKQKHFADKFCIKYEDIRDYSDKHLIPPPEKSYVDTLIRPLVLMCETFYAKSPKSPDAAPFDRYASLLQFITENHTTNITADMLSKRFNYSVSTISHMFKKYSGQSLTYYIETLRVDDAKHLLSQTKMQIAEIAALLGFCNSAYFSSVFKKRTGLSPKKYRVKFAEAKK